MSHKKIFSIANADMRHYSHDQIISTECSIVRIEEDERPPEYCFTSDYLTEVTSNEEIWAKGLFLLALYNGAVNIDLVNHDFDSQVKFVNLFDWETWEKLTPFDINDLQPENPFLSSGIPTPKNEAYPTTEHFISSNIRKSITEKDIQSLLLLAGNELTWIGLYSIYDTLKHYSSDFSLLVKTSGYDESDVKAFTGTANNFGLIGLSARHGEQGWAIPKRIMSHSDAKKMILKISHEYISQK